VQEENEMLSTIIDLSIVPYCTINERGIIQQANRAMTSTFGYDSPSELVGNNIKMCMTDDVAKNHDAFLLSYKEHHVKTVIDGKLRVIGKRKDGTTVPLETSVTEILNSDTGESLYLGFLRDVREECATSEAKLVTDAVLNVSPMPLITIDAMGTILRFSTAAEKEFGYAANLVIGENVKLLQPPEIAKEHDSYLQRYRETGVKHVVDTTRRVTARRMDKSQFDIEIVVRESKDGNGATVFTGFLRNVQAVEEQRKKRNSVLDMTEMLPVPFIGISPDGVVKIVNQATAAVFGYSVTEIKGNTVTSLMPPELRTQHAGFIDAYLRTGEKKVIGKVRRVKGQRKDGTQFPLDLRIQEALGTEFGQRFFYGFLDDMTNDAEIARETAVSNALLDMSAIPVIVIDSDGTVMQISRMALQAWKYNAAADVVGKNVKMLMPEPHQTNHDNYLRRYQVTGVKTVVGIRREVDAMASDGTRFAVSLMVSEHKRSTGESCFVGFVTVKNDTRQEEEEIETISALVNTPVLVIDIHGIMINVNRPAADFFLYKQDELVGKNVSMLMPKNLGLMHDSFLQKYIQTGISQGVVNKTRRVVASRKDGRVMDVTLKVTEHGEGNRRHFIGVVTDFTQTAKRELSEGLFSVVSSLLPVPFIFMDDHGRILEAAGLERVFGYSPAEIVGMNVKKLMPQKMADKHDAILAAYIESRAAPKPRKSTVVNSRRDVHGMTKLGQQVQLRLMVREVTHPTTGKLFFVGLFDDFTH